ncbi:CsgG/HfaB family protein [Devosia rhodophyticola]|uniref:CsgG/HfaB family protein n=1 Tax=Devosia rhodophyticola TaxID=3026423 RepID=A0ABY7YVY9_9HYPH|nr:CsgG/HfaB family protein [Devosia rhodophyticola]WDR05525.1 CsgG/HfaB family protein [Devosia rhodophyticola]
MTVVGTAMVVALAGCVASPFDQKGALTAGRYKPVLAPITPINADLRALPPPDKRITVSVYDFPDLTGQFKDQSNFQSLSKAVSQGGSAMLINALQDAGQRHWFTVLDRAALNDLLKERQIITEMRKVYRGENNINPGVLPPLDSASIILEGGITGYDTNVQTGGAGANFLGIGGNTKWTQDTITVTLRAVSTKTSEVLASVTVNKVIASVALDGNMFLYVQLDKLLQAETGYTQNEPKQIAVQGAIEKAVKSLILEGVQLNIWSFKNKSQGNVLVAQYDAEKYGNTAIPATGARALPATRNAAAVVQTQPIRFNAPPKATPVASVTTHPAPTGGAPSSGGTAPTQTALPPTQGKDGETLN